jgi:hypothetical protein
VTEPIVTSIRVELLGGHAHIGVWVRHGKAGELVVDRKDACRIEEMLAPARIYRRGPCARCGAEVEGDLRSCWDVSFRRPVRLLCGPCVDAVIAEDNAAMATARGWTDAGTC